MVGAFKTYNQATLNRQRAQGRTNLPIATQIIDRIGVGIERGLDVEELLGLQALGGVVVLPAKK